ncbi:MAG: cbb3-type cytochrome oxidase assembly protein CcoS [Rubripirellula sp.]
MSVIYIALPIALALGGAGMVACVLCIRGGQYDDMDTPALRILIDDRESDDAGETSNSVSPDQSPR